MDCLDKTCLRKEKEFLSWASAAMHADWQRITAQDVGSVIGVVEQFLLTQF